MVDRIPEDVGRQPLAGNGRPRLRQGRMARRMSFAARPRGSRWRRRLMWLALGLALGALVGLFYKMRHPSETLTLENLQQARQRWEQVAPLDYTMQVESQDRQHRVEVRDGAVVRMTTGGAPVNKEAAQYWTVEGLFRFLEGELANAEPDNAKRVYNVDDPSRIVLRVHYNPRFSYPAYFHRHIPGGVNDVELIVFEFEVSRP